MRRTNSFYRIIYLLLPLLLLGYACDEDNAEPDEEFEPFSGIWYATGDDVATIFRTPPLNIDSIVIKIIKDRDSRIRIEECIVSDNIKHVISADPSNESISNEAIYDYHDTNVENIFIIDIPASEIEPNLGAARFLNVTLSDTSLDGYEFVPVTVFGVFKIDTIAQPNLMTMEYYYSSWTTVNRSELLEGFGNTKYGEHGIHHFTKIEPDEDIQ